MTTALAAVPATRPDFAPPVKLTGHGHYLHWGFLQVSAANIVMIALIGVAFAVALIVPFPKHKPKGRTGE